MQVPVIHASHEDWRIDILGTDPDREASVLRGLCMRASSDIMAVREFETTISVYAELPQEAVIERIKRRYTGEHPSVLCGIVSVESIPEGMVYMGMMDYRTTDAVEGTGINSSIWLLRRGVGVGRWAVGMLGNFVEQKQRDPLDPMFRAEHWTAIRKGNIPSEQLALSYGFRQLGECAERNGYSIYRKVEN